MHTCVEGSKRQLPSWMMPKGGATPTHVSDSDNAVETNCSMNKVDNIAAYATKNDHKSRPSRRKSNLTVKCDDGSGSRVTQKKKKSAKSIDRDQRSSTKKRKKLEDPSHSCDDVYQVQASSDDAVDLTVEDLLAIAEQVILYRSSISCLILIVPFFSLSIYFPYNSVVMVYNLPR